MAIRDTSQEDSPWETEDSAADADSPLYGSKRFHAKSCATDENDHDLTANHQGIDSHKPVVLQDSLEDVKTVVETSIIEFVEDLHPDECVKDYRVHLRLQEGVVFHVVSKDTGSGEVENESDHQLVDGLSDNHLPHVCCK